MTNPNTEAAIIRAAAALVAPNAEPIVENLELVQDMAESAAAYLESDDSAPMWVEVSAVRGFGEQDGVTTCNDYPEDAAAFAVYIRNPLAFHVQDFAPSPDTDGQTTTLREEHGNAFRYAGALAAHLGCEVETTLKADGTWWPSRFVVEGQRDENGPMLSSVAGTHFTKCDDADATQWALFRLDVAPDGYPIAGTGDLIEDYPTRADAECAARALDRGEPLQCPIWPGAATQSALERIAARLRGEWSDPHGDLESDIAGVLRAAGVAVAL